MTYITFPDEYPAGPPYIRPSFHYITREEFESLKKEVENLTKLFKAASGLEENTSQEKLDSIMELIEQLKVDLTK